MQRTRQHGPGRRRTAVGAATVLGTLLAGLSLVGAGCDTTAEIAFPQVNLNRMFTIGVHNSQSCTATDDSVILSFGLTSTADDPLIRPGTVVNNVTLEIGETFSWDDVVFSDVILYPSPDVMCSSDTDCADVGNGFTCQRLNPQHDASSSVCGKSITVVPQQDTLVFENTTADIDYLVGLYYGGTVLGRNPDPAGTPALSLEWKADPGSLANAGATVMDTLLANTSGDRSRMCVMSWAAFGTANFLDSTSTCFSTIDLDRDRQRFFGLNAPTGEFPRALHDTISRGSGQYSNFGGDNDRHFVILTHGPDTSLAPNYQQALDSALAANVHLHFIQLDSVALIDGFEEQYPGAIGGDDEMSQLACETDGSFQMATENTDLNGTFRNLGFTMPGHFEIEFLIPALQDPALPAGPYRIAMTSEVTLHGEQKTFPYRGDTAPSGGFGQLTDHRITVFRR